jgi:F0F1-type ATP synthase alpha subunit
VLLVVEFGTTGQQYVYVYNRIGSKKQSHTLVIASLAQPSAWRRAVVVDASVNEHHNNAFTFTCAVQANSMATSSGVHDSE